MKATFDVKVDARRDLVRVRLAGFFGLDDVARYEASRNDAHLALRCGPNEHRTLVDLQELAVVSQETVAAFTRLLSNPTYASRRIAIVTGSALASMQIRRAARQREIGFFVRDRAAAEEWLLAGAATDADPSRIDP